MINEINIGFESTSPLPHNSVIRFIIDEQLLVVHGFTMPVIVQTPSVLCSPPYSKPLKTTTVVALFDTGASRTSISAIIARDLELELIGYSPSITAAGKAVFSDYTVDILFPNAKLKSFENLKVSVCDLPYDNSLSDIMLRSNFGVLIGRDMMARWNIVWNGPTSSVFISD